VADTVSVLKQHATGKIETRHGRHWAAMDFDFLKSFRATG